ncbi:MAG TPA: bifunctional DNA-formamidopyrimidine glycosylase/DNA-(apurinic or apyrimidinic site) lyase [Thermohalobaculum sp.]|nr:bifunctional DNA-formamidopyrimidine glycosylase/DNA-(apurinic or apyrimidinic site) lyase [Thermohalobaculum sp.]
MPELPEVETVRRGLEPVLAGATLAHVDQRRPDLRWPLPENFAERLTGRRVTGLGRRSKYLLVALDGNETWIVHLGMSGRILVAEAASPPPPPAGGRDGEGAPQGTAPAVMLGDFHHPTPGPGKHDHVIVTTGRGDVITYNDARRFGLMDLWPTDALESHPLLSDLGPEPLGNAFNGAALAAAFRAKRAPIKAALLDQRVVAGLGNIYVCEALHRAGISPKRLAGSLSRPRIDRLAAEVVATLNEAIAAGGSSLRDYRHTDGELGYFQHSFRVYDREAAPCRTPACPGTVARIVQSGRSTFHCPRCQR